MFDDLILSPAVRKSQHGSSIVSMRNVSKLLVSGGRYDNVEFDVDVETCEAWGEPVNCSQVDFILFYLLSDIPKKPLLKDTCVWLS